MAKKRTKRMKVKANLERVNSQLGYRFDKTYNLNSKSESAISTEDFKHLGSIKKELYKSLFIASLILISLVVVYWFS